MNLKTLAVAVVSVALIGGQVQAQAITVAPQSAMSKARSAVVPGVQRATSPKKRGQNQAAEPQGGGGGFGGAAGGGGFFAGSGGLAMLGFGLITATFVAEGINNNNNNTPGPGISP